MYVDINIARVSRVFLVNGTSKELFHFKFNIPFSFTFIIIVIIIRPTNHVFNKLFFPLFKTWFS